MATSINKYPKGMKKILDADIDLLVDTIKVALVTASYTPNTAHEFVSSLTNELSGGNYTRQTLGTKTTTAGTDAVFDAADTTFTNITAATAPRYAILFKDTGSDATSALIAYVDLDTIAAPAGQDLKITWNASGIFKI